MTKTQINLPQLLAKGPVKRPQPAVCPSCGQRETHKRWCPRR